MHEEELNYHFKGVSLPLCLPTSLLLQQATFKLKGQFTTLRMG